MPLKPAKMTNSWRKKGTRTKMTQLSPLPRRRSGLYVHRNHPSSHAVLDIHEDGFQDGNTTFSTLWKATFHSKHLNLPPCGYMMGTHTHLSSFTGKAYFHSLSTEVVCPSPGHVNGPWTMLLTLNVRQFFTCSWLSFLFSEASCCSLDCDNKQILILPHLWAHRRRWAGKNPVTSDITGGI